MRQLRTLLVVVLFVAIVMGATTFNNTAEAKKKTQEIVINEDDRETLARLLFLEGHTEGDECQRAIISVVLNRVEYGMWGDTIDDVIYFKRQFSTARKIKRTEATEKEFENIDWIIKNGKTLPDEVLFFRLKSYRGSKNYDTYRKIDRTYFGMLEDGE